MNRKILNQLVPVVAVAALLLAAPGHVSAAPVSAHSHERFSDSFPNNLCGIAGTSVVRGVENFKRFADQGSASG